MDNNPVSVFTLGQYFQVDGKLLQHHYKEHISDYNTWDQKDHATDWILFEQNMGPYLSIDETSVSSSELYTIVTNKSAKGRKGAIVAVIKGTQAEQIRAVLEKIPEALRNQVREVTLDMAANMIMAVKRSFPNADQVIDRFHVQKLAYDAVQEIRIKYRWEALDRENELIALAKKNQTVFQPEILSNGDTLKQLLARSRYLLFTHFTKWSLSQKQRAELLFERYPLLKKAYDLSIKLGTIYRVCKSHQQAYKKLALWYQDVESMAVDSFKTVSKSIESHYLSILNFFNNRSTNASAESFNAKIKAFRATSRGVRDIPFFLYRLSKIYA